MAAFRRFLLRLVHFVRPGRAESELEREVAAHLGVLEDEYRRRGMSHAESRLAARLALGGVEQLKERHRDARSFRWLSDLRQDIRFASRALVRAPGFSAVVIVTLALGIGANTAIFSVVHAVLLRSLPYPDADRFVRIALQFEPDDGSGTKTFAAAIPFEDLEFLRARSRTVSNLGTYTPEAATLSGQGEAVRLSGVRISPQVLAMLGATPLMGRLLEPREETPGLEREVVVSYSMWQRRLGGDDRILGKTVALDGVQHTVVAVMRPGFHFPDAAAEFWRPFVWIPRAQPVVVGRVNRDVSFQTASAEVNDLLSRARANRRPTANGPVLPGQRIPGAPPTPGPPPPPGPPPGEGPPPSGPPPAAGPPPPAPPPAARGAVPPPPPKGSTPNAAGPSKPDPMRPRFIVVGLLNELVAEAKAPLTILSCAVGFVLLIACVNVGGLFLARGTRREREIWVRLALGAGRGRVVRQLLTESVLLTLIGGAAGVWLAVTGVRWLRVFGAALPRQDLESASIVPRLEEVGVDAVVLLFALGISIVAALACGLVPALWQSRVEARGELARGSGSSAPGLNLFRRSRSRALLVVVQIGLAIILLLGGGLLVRSLLKLSSVNPGYATTYVLTFQVALPPGQSALKFSADLIARIQALTGVRAVGYADHLPLTRSSLGFAQLTTQPRPATIAPPPPPPGTVGRPGFPAAHIVSRDFLSAMGVAVVEGRGFSDADPGDQSRALLINRTLARSGFLGDHPIGMRVYTGGPVPWDVIGIVDDVRQSGLAEPPGHQIFASMERSGVTDTMFSNSSPYFAVRTDGPAGTLTSAIRDMVRDLDPQAVPDRVATMEEIVSNSVLRPRFYAAVFALFAAIAGTLAVVGIHGGIAFAVSRRAREIGIRMALGASARQIVGMLVAEGLTLAAVGIAAGVAGGAALTRYMQQMLFDLTPLDPAVFLAVPLVFGAVVAGAALLSARPAMRVAPLDALRRE